MSSSLHICFVCQGTNTTLSGPSGMSQYLWLGAQNNGRNTQSNTVSIAGTYTLQITDSNGCQNSLALPVTTIPCP
jgi:trimeric autotransporter adhesin